MTTVLVVKRMIMQLAITSALNGIGGTNGEDVIIISAININELHLL